MRVRIVLGIALAVVGVAVVVTLSLAKQRMVGTSLVVQGPSTVVLPAHAIACQHGTVLADDSAAAQLVVGTYGRPRPDLTLTFTAPDGTVVARGRRPGGTGQGSVLVPFAAIVDGNHVTTACVRNGGAHRVALAGAVANPDSAAQIGGRSAGVVVGFRYFQDGRASWWSLGPKLAQRFGLGKASLFGTWTLPALALILAGLWFVALRLLLRETT